MSHAPHSFKVADSLSAYRIVALSGENQVGAASTTTSVPVGITADEATKSNQAVPVLCAGAIAKVYCNDTFTAGGLVMTNASGQAVPAVATTAGVYAVGIILETVSETGTIAEILVNPFQLDIP